MHGFNGVAGLVGRGHWTGAGQCVGVHLWEIGFFRTPVVSSAHAGQDRDDLTEASEPGASPEAAVCAAGLCCACPTPFASMRPDEFQYVTVSEQVPENDDADTEERQQTCSSESRLAQGLVLHDLQLGGNGPSIVPKRSQKAKRASCCHAAGSNGRI